MAKRIFKAWEGTKNWTQKLGESVTVCRVDEDLAVSKQLRKPWYVSLTQHPDRVKKVGGVRGVPKGTTLLLSEAEVMGLVEYLLESETVALTDNGVTNPEADEWAADERKRAAARKPIPKNKVRKFVTANERLDRLYRRHNIEISIHEKDELIGHAMYLRKNEVFLSDHERSMLEKVEILYPALKENR
jgi:hypothetical protein